MPSSLLYSILWALFGFWMLTLYNRESMILFWELPTSGDTLDVFKIKLLLHLWSL